MSTINPTYLSTSPLIRKAGGVLPQIDQLRALIARKVPQVGLDGAELSGAVRGGAGLATLDEARQSLGDMSRLLGQLKEQVDRLGSGSSPSEEAQATIDELVSSIGDAAQRTGLGGRDGFSILDVAGQVTNLSVYNVKLAAGEEQQVEIDVRASAQQAGLFIDLRDGVLDLAEPNRSFTIEVGGRNGTKELTFSSGTSAGAIAQAINAISKQTGVEARLSGSGIRLDSRATGSAELTTLRVLDDGGAADDAGKIYRLKADNAGEIDLSSRMTFDSVIAHSGSGIRDKGQDAEVWVNGTKAAVYGSEVLASNDKFTALFFLDRLPTAAGGLGSQQLGVFTGFTIRADGAMQPTDPNGRDVGVTPEGPAQPVDPSQAFGADGAHLVPPIQPPDADYGVPPDLDQGLPGENGFVGAQGADDVQIVPPVLTNETPTKGPGGKKGGGDDGLTPDTGAIGARIDPETVREAIGRLVSRIHARTSALDLIERVGLDVVPASLSGALGIQTPPVLTFGGALAAANAVRRGVLDQNGFAADLTAGTASAQALRLLSSDGIR